MTKYAVCFHQTERSFALWVVVAADIPHTDSQEYKMWGNGIALPCLLPMMKAMADELDFSKHMNPPEE